MRTHIHDESCREDHNAGSDLAPVVSKLPTGARGRWAAFRDAAAAVIGTVLGIAPHVIHHVGLLAGAAVVTGASGNALFYLIGLALSVPMLRRLHRRFRTPWAPVIAVAVFTALFAVSAFVIGPAISGSDGPPSTPDPTNPTPTPSVDPHGH